MSSIFVKIEVKDYIPSEMADFANALVDPIAHLSKVSNLGPKNVEALINNAYFTF